MSVANKSEQNDSELFNLSEKRQRWVDANEENGFADGIRNLLTELYPDNAHFIYELLQNAEDKDATDVTFRMFSDRLEFEHNGKRQFQYENVEAITSIGGSTSRNEPTSIGKFGVGFKAVFAYTESPEVHSGGYHFRIRDLVVPDSGGVQQRDVGEKTLFVFPFDHPKKSTENAVAEIQRGLLELSDNTLLFLDKIETLKYVLPDDREGYLKRIECENGRVQIQSKRPTTPDEKSEATTGEMSGSTNWLRFQSIVSIVDVEDDETEKQCRVAIAFQLVPQEGRNRPNENADWKIAALDSGEVSIYFPAAKETSNLNFHMHAPFASTVARDSVRDCSANEQLRDGLAELFVNSLEIIRDRGLLTVEFLSVLPNESDGLSAFYSPFRDRVIEAFNSAPLTPKYRGGHAEASQLLRARAAIKSLLTVDDIRFVMELDDDEVEFDWAVGASQKNSRQDHFLSALSLTNWDVSEFISVLRSKTKREYHRKPDSDFAKWLMGKSDEWVQELYAALHGAAEASSYWQFTDLEFIRLSDNTMGLGRRSFFPDESVVRDSSLPRVKRQTYQSGKSEKQQKAARAFLNGVGVREVGEKEEIEAILEKRYSGDEIEAKRGDLKRFIALVESESDSVELFKDRSIFECADGEWAKPSQIYIDAPLEETGLSAYYEAIGDEADRFPLSPTYAQQNVSNPKLVKFADAVGAQTKLVPTHSHCHNNPEWDTNLRFAPGERWSEYSRDVDYTISDLADLLLNPSVALSRLVWKTMNGLAPRFLRAEYRVNRAGGMRTGKSLLVHTLASAAWVPQLEDGKTKFVKPLDANPDLLPSGFAYDRGQDWVRVVEFGLAGQKMQAKRDEKTRKQRELAKQLGVSPDKISRLAQLEGAKRAFLGTLDESIVGSSRRSNKLGNRTSSGRRRQSQQRSRQVRTARVSSDEVYRYLSAFYQIEDRWHCQMCCDEMQFRRRNGVGCREKRELFNGSWAESNGLEYSEDAEPKPLAECVNLYLLLCPLCQSFFNEYVFHVPDEQDSLFNWILDWDEDQREYVIDCSQHPDSGEANRTLHFHRKHLGDIRAVIRACFDETNDT